MTRSTAASRSPVEGVDIDLFLMAVNSGLALDPIDREQVVGRGSRLSGHAGLLWGHCPARVRRLHPMQAVHHRRQVSGFCGLRPAADT